MIDQQEWAANYPNGLNPSVHNPRRTFLDSAEKWGCHEVNFKEEEMGWVRSLPEFILFIIIYVIKSSDSILDITVLF